MTRILTFLLLLLSQISAHADLSSRAFSYSSESHGYVTNKTGTIVILVGPCRSSSTSSLGLGFTQHTYVSDGHANTIVPTITSASPWHSVLTSPPWDNASLFTTPSHFEVGGAAFTAATSIIVSENRWLEQDVTPNYLGHSISNPPTPSIHSIRIRGRPFK
jgi:hypothetical protein